MFIYRNIDQVRLNKENKYIDHVHYPYVCMVNIDQV